MKTKLLIFGISGDLSTRKLLPALKTIIGTGDFDDLDIIGVSRRELDISALLRSSLGDDSLKEKVSVFTMDLAAAQDYTRLREFIALGDDEQLLIYLSVPPSAAAQIVDFLGEAGVNSPNVKLLFEKPFGIDLTSAKEVIARTSRYFDESQIYRIDHYLAKEMAQNIVAFRAGNALFAHVWDHAAIESIEITATETIGIEGRAGFYEQTGALRDFVQGHLMQLLALVLMDVPTKLDWDAVPAKRQEALASLAPAKLEDAVRAQYEGYQEEAANPGSQTETFVSLKLASMDPRWQNVPIRLTTGKALDQKATEIRISFRKQHAEQSNCLTFKIQPNEGIEVDLFTKKPGYDHAFETQKLHFSYSEDAALPDAYEQVLVDAIRTKKSLFTSSEEVLASWRVLQPLLDMWAMEKAPLRTYSVGSSTHSICSV